MRLLILIYIITACSSSTVTKGLQLEPTREGLQKGIKAMFPQIKECNSLRPPWHKDLSYKVRVMVYLNSDSQESKVFLQSLPALEPKVKSCLLKNFRTMEFGKTEKKIRLVQIFNLK